MNIPLNQNYIHKLPRNRSAVELPMMDWSAYCFTQYTVPAMSSWIHDCSKSLTAIAPSTLLLFSSVSHIVCIDDNVLVTADPPLAPRQLLVSSTVWCCGLLSSEFSSVGWDRVEVTVFPTLPVCETEADPRITLPLALPRPGPGETSEPDGLLPLPLPGWLMVNRRYP